MIRDEIYRTLQGGNLQPGQRPADDLMIPTALYRQSIWSLMPRIALDISIVSPFRSSNLGQGSLSAAKSQAERKRRDREMA